MKSRIRKQLLWNYPSPLVKLSLTTNRPVHFFLLRHVYHSSISTLKVNKHTATLITFFLSAVLHELIMWCLFKKLRGYLLILQMFQLPVRLPLFSSCFIPCWPLGFVRGVLLKDGQLTARRWYA